MKQPTVLLGAVAELIRQVVLVLILFEVFKWSEGQQAGVMSVVSAALTVISIILTHHQTVSKETANEQIRIATYQNPGTSVEAIKKLAEKSKSEN